jgi:hypothetical protein
MAQDQIAEHERKIREIELAENARNLSVRPYLRILCKLRKSFSEYDKISVKLLLKDSIICDSNVFNIELSNNGMGAALNVKCRIKGEQQIISQDNGVSMDKSESYVIELIVCNHTPEKEEKIIFIFSFNDIFNNMYEQEISATFKIGVNGLIRIDNIEPPKLIVQADK